MTLTSSDISVAALVFATFSVTVSHVMTWIAASHTRRVLDECINNFIEMQETKVKIEEMKTAADDLQDRLFDLQKSRFSYMGDRRNSVKKEISK